MRKSAVLSYQHMYHAGNLADVHKHALLACVLAYMVRKDKPLSYLETHGGRGLYDLSGSEAAKTGEAAVGIGRMEGRFAPGHPYLTAIRACRDAHGEAAYPGSPWIAAHLLRQDDRLHVAELHPQEGRALAAVLPQVSVHRRDGFEMAHSLCPPQPRRGVMLIDPSYEVKTDYEAAARHIPKISRAWGVGVIMLWYPILTDRRHDPMVEALARAYPDALRHEVAFGPAREGHRMIGSGMFVVRAPWGLSEEAARLGAMFEGL